MKKILGLDLGTNSIGWALVETNENGKPCKIAGMGSRIIPMDQSAISDFERGNSKSQTAERTRYRGIRRLRERELIRRERLHRILNELGFLPDHYQKSIDFEKRLGKFKENLEPKLAWRKNSQDQLEFLFQDSFGEMLNDFSKHQPNIVAEGKKVPYDWTIYFLRKKALTERIQKEELAWILLNFNQKRGYYQLRGEDDEDATRTAKTRKYFDRKTIKSIVDTGQDYKGLKILIVELEDGNKGKIFKKEIPDWIGHEKNIIATVDLDKDGNDRHDEGILSQRFSIPTDAEWETEWKLIKLKTEKDLSDSNKTVGSYIYDTLLQNPNQKIKGKLVRTVERKFYKEELKAILNKQKEFHRELNDATLYSRCISTLYPNNETYRNSIANKDFIYLLMDDIIFYQRPLKSKKSLISDCPYEERKYKDKETGEVKVVPIKCIAKSHPLFQEFRLWQFVSNLRIYRKDKTDIDVTSEFLRSEDDYETLFLWLNDRKEIDQKAFLKYPAFGLRKGVENYRWNYVEDKTYPCNKTRNAILSKLDKSESSNLTKELEFNIWQLLYSVNTKEDINKALKINQKRKNRKKREDQFEIIQELKECSISDSSIEKLKMINFEEKDYGSYSAKAIKKLLPLMRMGKSWSIESIDSDTQKRIDKIITGQYDEKIRTKVRDKAIHLGSISDFKGLPVWLACYVVYDRHSEAKDISKWKKPEDIDVYLKKFKQHSLRNPIVEQIITETLRVVHDIWRKHAYTVLKKDEKGNIIEGVSDLAEIHIELGREMKHTKADREKISKMNSENENTNLRIKKMLTEFINPEFEIEDVRPYSPSQQEILRIYEDGVLKSGVDVPDFVGDILKKFKETDSKKQPSTSDVLRYKLWLEQKYRSPYTNEMIPLGKLFTSDYQIEHVIPQSRYFDDSFSNKVICESEVNQLKDNDLGYEFIKNNEGRIIELSFGKSVKILSVDEYEQFVQQNYSGNRPKMKKLLMDEIPNDFIERQLNDSRYISKVVKGILSNVVREEGEEEPTSKNLISCTGGITDRLKKDWGLNDVWNNLIYPRFERLNQLTNSNQFGYWDEKDGKRVFQIQMPLELQKGFNKKRIDHRHHAMDALVIACATRSHVNYLNNESAKANAKETRYDLRRKLRRIETIQKEKIVDGHKVVQNIEVAKEFYKPWSTFTQDAQTALSGIIVSFKQNLRVINKTSNYYETFKDENGNLRLGRNGKPLKGRIRQSKGENWAVRKPMNEETVSGLVKLSWVKLKKDEITTATRKVLDKSFDEEKIKKITDVGIQKILLNYLKAKDYNSELAFSVEGIEDLNRNISQYNDNKSHLPIFKVRVYEKGSGRFILGEQGNKRSKYVQGSPNLFFAIYTNEQQQCKGADKKPTKRCFETIPLNIVIERLKQRLNPVPETNQIGEKLLFYLTPSDLIYVPSEEDNLTSIDFNNLTEEQKKRLYNVNDFSSSTCYFTPNRIAKAIMGKEVDLSFDNKRNKLTGSFDAKTASLEGVQIKEVCIPIKVDRLGNIISQ